MRILFGKECDCIFLHDLYCGPLFGNLFPSNIEDDPWQLLEIKPPGQFYKQKPSETKVLANISRKLPNQLSMALP